MSECFIRFRVHRQLTPNCIDDNINVNTFCFVVLLLAGDCTPFTPIFQFFYSVLLLSSSMVQPPSLFALLTFSSCIFRFRVAVIFALFCISLYQIMLYSVIRLNISSSSLFFCRDLLRITTSLFLYLLRRLQTILLNYAMNYVILRIHCKIEMLYAMFFSHDLVFTLSCFSSCVVRSNGHSFLRLQMVFRFFFARRRLDTHNENFSYLKSNAQLFYNVAAYTHTHITI